MIKNTEDKTTKDQIKSQSKPIESDINNSIKFAFKKLRFFGKLSLEAKEILDEIAELDKEIDCTKLILIKQAIIKQNEMKAFLKGLNASRPQKNKNRLEKKLFIMHTNFLKEEK